MRSPTSARILIVGGGIAGLGTARALARAGFAAEVVERQRTWQEAGAGIYLPGNAARALRALDLEHTVLDKAVVITSQRVSDHRDRLLVEVDVAGLWNGVGPCLALQRADLHAVLLDGAEVPIRMDVDVRGLHHGNGPLTVEFAGGDAAEYDLVIGLTEFTAACARSFLAARRRRGQWVRSGGASSRTARSRSRPGR